jgi:plasmid maintenance system antidote protein VapI
MFPNLKAEMARQNISSLKMSEYIGCTPKTFSSKMTGKTDFTRSEIFKIQKAFFPNFTVEYLFSEKRKVGELNA